MNDGSLGFSTARIPPFGLLGAEISTTHLSHIALRAGSSPGSRAYWGDARRGGTPVDGLVTPPNAATPPPPVAESTYRPRYELVAEQVLQLIAERGLRPGD